MKAYVATVQLLVLAESAEEASLLILGTMEDLSTEEPRILDWGYLKLGGHRLYPTEHAISPVDPEKYHEGDFLRL